MAKNKNENPENKKDSKKSKKKGIIRVEAIGAAIVVLALLGLYLIYFFDHNLKYALEWTLSRVHGAEVNVSHVKTKFSNLQFDIHDIEFTYDRDPTLNVVQVKKISANLTWKAILQAKYIIPEAQIENIQTMIPRKRKGFVFRQAEKAGVRGAGKTIEANFKKQVQGNIVTDLYQLSKGIKVEDQLKKIQTDLKTDMKIKELETTFKEKKEFWDKKFKELPQKSDLKAYEQRVKKLKIKSKKITDVALQIKDATDLYKEIKTTIKDYKTSGKNLRTDLKGFTSELSGIDQLIKSDLADMKKKFNIPSIDPAEISKGVFFPILQAKLLDFKRKLASIQEYLPKKKTEAEKKEKEESAFLPRERGKGRTYYFPKKNSYPKFWLKKAFVSSKSADSDYSGNFKGTITNVSNNPKHIGLPIVADISGEVPKQKISGIKALITVDHTGDVPKENAVLSVGSYPAKGIILSEGNDLAITIAETFMSSKIVANHSNNNIDLQVNNIFNDAKYDISSKSDSLKKIVMQTFLKMASLTLNGAIKGTWKDFDLSLNSNFGKELSSTFKNLVKDKITEAEQKIKSKVFGRIEEKKKKLQGDISKFSNLSLNDLNSREDFLNKLKDEANKLKSQKNIIKKIDKDKLKEKGKKLLKDLFK